MVLLWRTGGGPCSTPSSSLQTGLIEADFMVCAAIMREESVCSEALDEEEQSLCFIIHPQRTSGHERNTNVVNPPHHTDA